MKFVLAIMIALSVTACGGRGFYDDGAGDLWKAYKHVQDKR